MFIANIVTLNAVKRLPQKKLHLRLPKVACVHHGHEVDTLGYVSRVKTSDRARSHRNAKRLSMDANSTLKSSLPS